MWIPLPWVSLADGRTNRSGSKYCFPYSVLGSESTSFRAKHFVSTFVP